MYRLLALVSMAKLLLLLIDPNLRLFMGDSASYLHAALTDWDPPDRSFTYPEIVAWTAVQTDSAFTLVVVQSLMGIAGCALAFSMLRCAAGVGPRLSTVAALLVAIEPTQLFYERMLMAESAGLLALLITIAASVAYVQRGRLLWTPVIAVAGVLAVSFRMSLLPVVLGLAMLTPLLRYWHMRLDFERTGRRGVAIRTAIDAAVLGVLLLGAHVAYQQAYGLRMASEPTYMVADGKMRLGLLAPLIAPEHFEAAGLERDFATDLGIALEDHRNREAQIWAADGLWARLEEELGPDAAEQVAGDLATMALKDDPLGLPRMGIATLLDYFHGPTARWRLHDDFGQRPPSESTLDDLSIELRYDARNLAQSPGLVGWLFLSSRWWLTAVLFLLAPLALACLILNLGDPRRRPVALVVGFTALGLVASQFLFSHIVSFRYLHPMPVLFVLSAALAAQPLVRLVRRGKRQEPDPTATVDPYAI